MDLSAIEIFVKVVDAGSFSAAARALGVSKSHTSKRVSQLEDRLGARLLQRTTRRLTLTEAGRLFYDRCARVLDELSEAEQVITELSTSPRGTLRMAVPMSFGVRFVAPLVADFTADFPEIDVDVQHSDARVDLLADEFDLAIRIGQLSDSSMVARKVSEVDVYICASPDYLAKHGTPETPRDLRDHQCLIYTESAMPGVWSLGNGETAQTVHVSGPIRSNSGDTIMQACVRGQGIAMVPDFLAAEFIRDGRLVTIMDNYRPSTMGTYVIFPHRRHLSPKVRSFVDYVAARWKFPPWSCADCLEMAS